MPTVIENLLALQSLEWSLNAPTAADEARISTLRAEIPPPVLDHYDRLMDRGKKGVALARHGVCCECHIKICSGTWVALAHAGDICVCDSCGRYLCLAPENEPEAPVKLVRRCARKGRVAGAV